MRALIGFLIFTALGRAGRCSEQESVTGIDPCLSQPCENGGTCVFDNDTSYRCDCAPGFEGTECHDVDCDDQQFVEDATEITSPFYPQQYPLYKRCSYRLESDPGKLIQVKFSKFALETSHGCVKDYVDFYDGGDSLSPIIGTYCGHLTPEAIVTSGPRLFIVFRSDGSVSEGGFHITATPIDDDGTPSSTRTDYTVKEDVETRARGGTLYSHRNYPDSASLPRGLYELTILPDRVYGDVYLNFKNVYLTDEKIEQATCNIEEFTARDGSDINDGEAEVVASVEECCHVCQADKDCKSYGYDTRQGNCWLKDKVPTPSDSKDFHSGIVTNCDSMREKIKIKSNGRLVDVLCRGNYGKDYVINGRVTLELHISEASQTEKGFDAIYTLFHMSDTDGNCQNKDDFRCGNGRCISGYLRDKEKDHCGNASNILTASKGLTLMIVVTWLLSIVAGF